jgi:hypothetical protein
MAEEVQTLMTREGLKGPWEVFASVRVGNDVDLTPRAASAVRALLVLKGRL